MLTDGGRLIRMALLLRSRWTNGSSARSIATPSEVVRLAMSPPFGCSSECRSAVAAAHRAKTLARESAFEDYRRILILCGGLRE